MPQVSIPNVGDIVLRKSRHPSDQDNNSYRVTGWMKIEEKPFCFTGYDMALSGAMRNELSGEDLAMLAIHQIREEMDAEDDAYARQIYERQKKRIRLIPCHREEATHLTLSGVCGRIQPVAECQVVGQVNWPEKQIQEHIHQANMRAANVGPDDAVFVYR